MKCMETLVDIFCCLCGCLQEVKAMLLRECLSLFCSHFSLVVQIALISDKCDDNPLIGILSVKTKKKRSNKKYMSTDKDTRCKKIFHSDHPQSSEHALSPAVLQPRGEVFECLAACDVIHQQSTSGTPIIRSGDRTKLFLSSCIPEKKKRASISNPKHFTPSSQREGLISRVFLSRDHKCLRYQICSFTRLPSISIVREPNSTPMVKS
jgi:hypothetical protein